MIQYKYININCIGFYSIFLMSQTIYLQNPTTWKWLKALWNNYPPQFIRPKSIRRDVMLKDMGKNKALSVSLLSKIKFIFCGHYVSQLGTREPRTTGNFSLNPIHKVVCL